MTKGWGLPTSALVGRQHLSLEERGNPWGLGRPGGSLGKHCLSLYIMKRPLNEKAKLSELHSERVGRVRQSMALNRFTHLIPGCELALLTDVLRPP